MCSSRYLLFLCLVSSYSCSLGSAHHRGRFFVVAFPVSIDNSSLQAQYVTISNLEGMPANVIITTLKLEMLLVSPVSSMYLVVPPWGERDSFMLNDVFTGLVLGESRSGGSALHIRSTTDIVVVAHVMMTDPQQESDGCSLLYPVHRLGSDYLVVTECATFHCFLLVVAAGYNTLVSIELSLNTPTVDSTQQPVHIIYNGQAYKHGDTIQQALYVGEFMQILTYQVDLSGSRVRSNVPVAVFSGGDYTALIRGTHLADDDPRGMILEQAPPLDELGELHTVVSYPETYVDRIVKVVFTESDTIRLTPVALREPLSKPRQQDYYGGANTEQYEYLILEDESAMFLAYNKPVLVMVISAQAFSDYISVAGVIVTPTTGWAHTYSMAMSQYQTTLVLMTLTSAQTFQSTCRDLDFKIGGETVGVSWSNSDDHLFYYSYLEANDFSSFINISSSCTFGGFLYFTNAVKSCTCALGWQIPGDDKMDTGDGLRYTSERTPYDLTEWVLRYSVGVSTEERGPQEQTTENGNFEDEDGDDGEGVTSENKTLSSTIIATTTSFLGSVKSFQVGVGQKNETTPSTKIGEDQTAMSTQRGNPSDAPSDVMVSTEPEQPYQPGDQTKNSLTYESTTYVNTFLGDTSEDRQRDTYDAVTPQTPVDKMKMEQETESYIQSIVASNVSGGHNTDLFEQTSVAPKTFESVRPGNLSLLCPCECGVKRRWLANSQNRLKLEQALRQQMEMLVMQQSSLSRQRRRYTSAVNTRDTAQSVGVTLTVFAVLVAAAFLLLGDVCSILGRHRVLVPPTQLDLERDIER